MIILKTKEWTTIRQRLREEFHWKPSVLLISDVMKHDLGFLPRHHEGYRLRTAAELKEYDQSDNIYYQDPEEREFHRLHVYEEHVCLDFYDDAKETWFRLRYLHNEQ